MINADVLSIVPQIHASEVSQYRGLPLSESSYLHCKLQVSPDWQAFLPDGQACHTGLLTENTREASQTDQNGCSRSRPMMFKLLSIIM